MIQSEAQLLQPPTSRQKQDRRYGADIQGIRAFAVLVVVLYHAGLPMRGRFVGVDMFFVVSGFVITGMLTRELATSGRISCGRFYLKRARRLLPAAAIMLVVVTATSALLITPLAAGQQAAGLAASAASVFMANAYFVRYSGGYFDALMIPIRSFTLGRCLLKSSFTSSSLCSSFLMGLALSGGISGDAGGPIGVDRPNCRAGRTICILLARNSGVGIPRWGCPRTPGAAPRRSASAVVTSLRNGRRAPGSVLGILYL